MIEDRKFTYVLNRTTWTCEWDLADTVCVDFLVEEAYTRNPVVSSIFSLEEVQDRAEVSGWLGKTITDNVCVTMVLTGPEAAKLDWP